MSGRKRKHAHRNGNGKYIAGIIASIAVIIAAFGVAIWVLMGGMDKASDGADAENPSDASPEVKTQEDISESQNGEDATDGEAGLEENGGSQLENEIEEIIDTMTLEEKVSQLFMVTPEALTGVGTATRAGETTKNAIDEYPVGGVIYFSKNLTSPEQTKEMLSSTQQYASEHMGFPVFLSVDEEGGEVARIGSNAAFGTERVGNMSDVGARGDTQEAYDAGSTIGAYLKELGFNMDAAPDADVLTNPQNQVVKNRSFGSDPQLVASMAAAQLEGLGDQGITGMYKHFPGHGGTTGDSHAGYAYVDDTLEELKNGALVPFQDGIDNGVDVIMVSHIACPNVTGDDTPATLSKTMITDILRDDMGFDGMVMTDALDMGAITAQYSPGEAAVKSLIAGADMLLMPEDFQSAYQGVLDAVGNGTLTEERIDESVRRILKVKMAMEI